MAVDKTPLVLLHGVTDTPRTWDLVRPLLEPHHEILAPTLLGHSGGPPLGDDPSPGAIADQLEREMDEAGLDTAHLAGNSLGGAMALELAARGRARSVVALAPAGGWADEDPDREQTAELFRSMQELVRGAAPYADQIASTPEGRARALAIMCENPGHVPADLVADQIRGAADCAIVLPLVELTLADGWPDFSGPIDVPIRIVWGTEDKVLRWPNAAARLRDLLPQAEWVEMDGIGHGPQLDDPYGTAELILEVSAR